MLINLATQRQCIPSYLSPQGLGLPPAGGNEDSQWDSKVATCFTPQRGQPTIVRYQNEYRR